MNILFIYSTYNIDVKGKFLNNPGKMYFGISYISSVLKQKGHKVSLLVLSQMLRLKNYTLVKEYIEKTQPQVIAFTSVATEYNFISSICKYIKQNYPDIYLVIGGVHATLNPDEVLEDDFDAICIGEGEESTIELVEQLQDNKIPSKIQNFIFKNRNGIERNSLRPFIKDLDSIPFADRELWDEWVYSTDDSEYMIILGRGCPFQCTYCSNHALKKITTGDYVRFRSPENIINEIKDIKNKNPQIRRFYFEVETICVNVKWMISLCNQLEIYNTTLDVKIEFGTNLRVTPKFDFTNILIELKRAGCVYINIGLESGSERLRREILKRFYPNEIVIDTVQFAKNLGMKVFIYNIIGLPTETLEDFAETIRINRICQPTTSRTSVFYPYKGTQLYNYCIENNLIDSNRELIIERVDTILNLPTFPRKEILKNFYWFEYNIFKGKKPVIKYFIKALIRTIISKPYFIFLNKIITSKILRKFIRKYLSI